MINDRKKRILQAIIDDYVLTAEPVGSRTISRKYMQELSSATIRNEMSDLEELGYLEQPHVSAGRIPNARAYRLYVDYLLNEGIAATKREDESRFMISRTQKLEEVITATAQALSDYTHYTSIVMMPRQSELRIATLQLIPLSTATALLVIVTDGGIIRDSVVHVSETLDADGLYAISRMLTERLGGRSLTEVQAMLREYMVHTSSDPRVLQGISELAEQMQRQTSDDTLTVCSPQNILNYPEYADVKKARAFLSVLEEKNRLLHLIKNCDRDVLRIYIGTEHGITEMGECSIVTASYEVGKKQRGVVGLIGPIRMPYQSILSTLVITGSSLSRLLNHNEM